jgi:CheY-like chemotaxis protein
MAERHEPLRVLSVEDDPAFTELIRRSLERDGFKVAIERVQTRTDLERALDDRSWDVILSDEQMPGFDALSALALVNARGLVIPFIVVSGFVSDEHAEAAKRAGARDHVPKSELARLGAVIRRERDPRR